MSCSISGGDTSVTLCKESASTRLSGSPAGATLIVFTFVFVNTRPRPRGAGEQVCFPRGRRLDRLIVFTIASDADQRGLPSDDYRLPRPCQPADRAMGLQGPYSVAPRRARAPH